MKRFHVHVGVDNLDASIRFYSTLFAAGQPLTESTVAPKVITLTQEVLKSMFLTKLKLGALTVTS